VAEMGLIVFPRLVAVQGERFTVCLCSHAKFFSVALDGFIRMVVLMQ
jgi:hypothetical protein